MKFASFPQQQFTMPSSTFLSFFFFFFFFFTLIIGHRLAFAQPRFITHICVNGRNNHTTGDGAAVYRANLDHLLSTLTTDQQIDYGFYNFSYGQQNRANVIGLCRADVSPEACRSCLNNSRVLLPLRCPTQNEAIGWYDNCMLRYSDRPIFGSMEILPRDYLWNPYNASDEQGFTQAARNLIVDLIGEATAGDSRVKFAIGNASVPKLPTIYGLAQCTPDLSRRQCNECLIGALPLIRECCDGKAGGRVLRPSCHFRYESYPLIQSQPPSPPPQPPPPPLVLNRTTDGNTSNKSVTAIAIAIAVAVPFGLVAIVAVLTIGICIFKRRRPKIDGTKCRSDEEISTVGFLQFDFDTIRIATDGFSAANRLGEGGFGAVYEGKLPNGRIVAVKRLSQISRHRDVEFKNEVVLVAKLHHRNLVKLLGFCSKENEKLLIYEFLQNGSLEKIVFDPLKRTSLDWTKRYKIIQGITRGLIYLHEGSRIKIIHRDLKASNILLDAEMNAKISDFGTAKLFLSEQTQGDTSTIIGTYGYMAPEYVKHGHFSTKSDVFSFGILVLEIVTGQKNNHIDDNENIEDHLISYAWRNWREGTALNIVDASIKIQSGMRNEVTRCIHIGLLCIQEKVDERPSMASVLVMLHSDLADLPTPSKPSFFINTKDNSHIT